MNTYKGRGSRIQWVNGTGASVAGGAVVDLGDIFGILVVTTANGATGTVMIDEEHQLTARTAGAWAIGDDLYWDATNGNLTEIGGSANKFIGKATRLKAIDDTTARFKLNVGAPISPELLDRVWEAVAGALALDIQDVGKVMNLTATAVITLPATSLAYHFIIRNGAPDGDAQPTVSPAAADSLYGADLAGVDNVDRVNTLATAKRGDFISLRGDGLAPQPGGYAIVAEKGIWTP